MIHVSRRVAALLSLLLLVLVIPAVGNAQPDRVTVIVTLGAQADSEAVARDNARRFGGEVGYVYRHALKGFTLTLPAQAVAGLTRAPGVMSVEPDFVAHATQVGSQPLPTGVDRVEADLNPPASPVPVDIAIIDTGIWYGTNPNGTPRSHPDLNLRYFTDCTSAIFYPIFGGCSGGGQDDNGHGTHVAGIAAAYDNSIGSIGTAPGATLWSFKVLGADGTGTGGAIIAAIDLVAANANQIEVANMSLGFAGSSAAVDTAITNAVNAGVVFAAAAGNDSADAAGFSPASHPDVITVSALADFDGKPGGLGAPTCRQDQDDTLADFSNYGSLVEIVAPGVCIFSTHLNDGYATFSGTSMASPAVAGAAARYLAHIGLDPTSRTQVLGVRSALVAAGAAASGPCGWTGDRDSFPEPLLFVNANAFGGSGSCGGTPPPPPNTPPTASFTSSCTDLACTFTDASSDPDGSIVGRAWTFGDGGTSSEVNPSHTYSGPGTFEVRLTVTDNGGATASTTRNVTVTRTATKVTASVGPIGVSGRVGTVAVTVTNDLGDPASAASVAGRWTYLDRNRRSKTVNVTQTTSTSGIATFTYTFPRGSTIQTFCVTNVTATGLDYVPAAVTCSTRA
jgi:subtilisin family serine protease